MLTSILLISVIGALMCLDRVALQIMVSRPIVIAPVIGLVLGVPYAGLIIGALIELFWIDRAPIGIYIPPNDSIAAVLAVSMAALTGKNADGVTPELISLSILIAIPLGIVARWFDVWMIKSNNELSDQALADAEKSDFTAIEKKNILGLVKVFFFYAAFLMIFQTILVFALNALWPCMPAPMLETLSLAYFFLPIVGIAAAIQTIKLRGAIPVFCAIFLIFAVTLEILHVW